MRLLSTSLFAVLSSLFSVAFCVGNAFAAEFPQEIKLSHGIVKIYDYGSLKLHVYQTSDLMNDVCFILESPTNLVAIESPAFEPNIEDWKEYSNGLNKPLTDILISYHPAGGNWYGNAKSHATANAKNAITEGATRALTNSLGTAFGDGFNTDIPRIDSVMTTGTNKIGGVDFIVTDAGDGYDIVISSINVIYTHMLGADTHSILAGQDHIQSVLASLADIKAKKYQLILSSHHAPESLADVDTKIAYVKNIQQIAKQSVNKDAFVTNVKQAYPDYAGDNYLDMTASFLFPSEAVN